MGRKLRILLWYGIGILSLYLHHLINNAEAIKILLQKSMKQEGTTAFSINAILGLASYTLLISGMLIPILVSIVLIRNHLSER